MTPLVPIALYGWVLVCIYFFSKKSPQQAVLYSVIGGVLFLPMATYDYPLIGEYNKHVAIALGILLGERISGKRGAYPLKMRSYDLPMILWCFASPLATSLSNNLGLYDGISGMIQTYLRWGVFYWAGRRYFGDRASMQKISWGVIIGGVLYIPLILYELRMSPQLHKMLYGFYPAAFIQHIRYGGYRPMVFMQHGLMVSVWMAAATTIAYWLWRAKRIEKIWGVAAALVVAVLIVLTILTKSADGWVFLILGLAAYSGYRKKESPRLVQIALLAVPLYIALRITPIISYEQVQAFASNIFDPERIVSLTARLRQEDLFGAHAMRRPLFGWGGFGRSWPVDLDTGKLMLDTIDSLWVIAFSGSGLFGLASVFLAIGLGPWLILSRRGMRRLGGPGEYFSLDEVALSLIVVFFLLNLLLNTMINQVYLVCSGALISRYCTPVNDERCGPPKPRLPSI